MKLGKRLIAIVLSTVLIACLGAGNMQTQAMETVASDTELKDTVEALITVEFRQSEARAILPYVNALRASGAMCWNQDNTAEEYTGSMGELIYDYTLEKVAMQRAVESIVIPDHERPNGETYTTAYPDGEYMLRSENLVAGSAGMLETARDAYTIWLEEGLPYERQSHRRNMLRSNMTAIGVACVYFEGRCYWAMEIGRPGTGGKIDTADPGVVNGERTVSVDIEYENLEDVEFDEKGLTGRNNPDGMGYQITLGERVEAPTWNCIFPDILSLGRTMITVPVAVSYRSVDESVVTVENGYMIGKSVGGTGFATEMVHGTNYHDFLTFIEVIEPNPIIGQTFATYDGYTFTRDESNQVRCYDSNGNPVINDFKCDGTYTYYFQLDGTAMKDRLTYHPDGVHVIYFDGNGHEVFSDFANVRKSIAGDAVDDMCFFNVYGYMYVDTLTYDKTGQKLYYVNPYGVLERNGWFQFSGNEFGAGLGFGGRSGGRGYANADCSLMTNTYTYDDFGRLVYVQGDGHVFYD